MKLKTDYNYNRGLIVLKEASKSGPIKYSFVKPVDCSSGRLKNTYALAQNGKVVLKQISKDGSIGPVCIK